MDRTFKVKSKTRIRMAIVAVAFAVATAFTAVAAQPAQAAVGDCTRYLRVSGYRVTLPRYTWCVVGATDRAGAYIECVDGLQRTGVAGVIRGVASQACRRARW